MRESAAMIVLVAPLHKTRGRGLPGQELGWSQEALSLLLNGG